MVAQIAFPPAATSRSTTITRAGDRELSQAGHKGVVGAFIPPARALVGPV